MRKESRTASATASGRAATELQWLGVWSAATALLAFMGTLAAVTWVSAGVTGLLAVAAGWRWWLAWLEKRRASHLDALYRASGQAAVDSMTGVEFEHYVAAVLRGLGYAVELTKVSGDFGVDLIAIGRGGRTAVQCKRAARPVSSSAVQQVVAGAAVYGCSAAIVVTNHRYTRAAEHLAAVHDCLLVDRTRLARLARPRRNRVGSLTHI